MRKQPALLKVITDEEVEKVHQSSLRILSEIGVHYPSHQILDRLEAIGTRVNRAKQIATFPPEVIEKVLAEVPKDFSLCPADGGPPVKLGDGQLQLSMDQTPDIVDYMTNTKSRKPANEILKGIAVANALENVRLASGYCLPNDIPETVGDVISFQLLWTYSKKAVGSWIYSTESAKTILDMAVIVAGCEENLRKKKILTYFAEPISPLRWARHSLDIILLLTEYACPIYLGPMVTAGGSGPVTLAGTLAMHNAEVLQGLATIYACNPKQPAIYSSHMHRLDMSRGTIMYGSPEQALLSTAATQLARRYGLAVAGNMMLHDSNCPDYMAGFEAGATAAYALAAGWDMLGFIGFGTIGVVGAGVGLNLEQVIMQDEALGYLQRMIRSFEVNEDTLAFDVTKKVGIGGNFLAEMHTVKHLRYEFWQDKGIFSNLDYDKWSQSGAESALDRAHKRLNEILETDLPLEPVLSKDKVKELEKIARITMNGKL